MTTFAVEPDKMDLLELFFSYSSPSGILDSEGKKNTA